MRQWIGAATAWLVVGVGCAGETAVRQQVVEVPASSSQEAARVQLRLPGTGTNAGSLWRFVASPPPTVDVALVWTDPAGTEWTVDGAGWGGVETLDGVNPSHVVGVAMTARARNATHDRRVAVEAAVRPRWLGEEQEPNDLGDDAQLLLAGQQVTGSVGWSADRDCYRLPAGLAAQGWTVAVTGPPAPWLDVVLDLEDAANNVLESWDRRRGGAGERLTRSATAAAEIAFVCVRALDAAHAREVYFLEVTPLRPGITLRDRDQPDAPEGSEALQ